MENDMRFEIIVSSWRHTIIYTYDSRGALYTHTYVPYNTMYYDVGLFCFTGRTIIIIIIFKFDVFNDDDRRRVGDLVLPR